MSEHKVKMKNIRRLKRIFAIKKALLTFIILSERLGITMAFATFFNWLLRAVGIQKNVLTYSNYRRYGKAFKEAFKQRDSKGRKVLFPMMFGNNSNFNLINLLIAKDLDSKGLHPAFLVCNSTYSICGRERVGKQRKGVPLFCYECYGGYSKLKQTTGIDLEFMNSFFTENVKKEFSKETASIDNISNIENCLGFEMSNGFKLGRETKKRILKFFFRSTLLGTPEEVDIYKKFIKEGVKYYLTMNNYLDNYPDIRIIILQNGTLSFGNYLFDIAKRRGIDIITYETYLGNNSLIYKKNDEVMKLRWPMEMISYFKNNPLKENDKLLVDNFFKGLQKGKDMYAVLNKEHNANVLIGVKRYVCLFTNLNFDTSVLDRNTIFSSMENWIYEVIDYWQENITDTALVIRVHPAELKLITPSSDFIGEKIRQRISKPNVVLIDSADEVNSYRLIENMEFGLIYSSTIGLEASYLNKLCLIAGDPFYKEEPFVLTPKTKENYFIELKRLLLGIDSPEPDKESLYRFVFFMYFVRLKKFKGLHIQYRGNIENNKISHFSKLIEDNRALLNDFYNESIL